jgi:hypothetical protein
MNEPQIDLPTSKVSPSNGSQVALLSPSGFELAQRMAKALSQSSIIPETYRNNLANCLIALEMAHRMNASPMMVMQNLYIVHGKPSWSGQFIVAAINSTGRFSPLRFDMKGEGDSRECTAWANELATKERLEGPAVSIKMAKAEGWHSRNGSKWQTMPELMLRYRAATFFGRLYAPEVLMGMRESDEVIDIESTVQEPVIPIEKPIIAKPKVGRSKKVKLEAKPKEEQGPFDSDLPLNKAPTNVELIEKRLADSGHTKTQLLEVAVANEWIDKLPGGDLAEVPLASVGEEKLGQLLEFWDVVAEQLPR